MHFKRLSQKQDSDSENRLNPDRVSLDFNALINRPLPNVRELNNKLCWKHWFGRMGSRTVSATFAPEVVVPEVAAQEMAERKVQHTRIYRQLWENSKCQYLIFCQQYVDDVS